MMSQERVRLAGCSSQASAQSLTCCWAWSKASSQQDGRATSFNLWNLRRLSLESPVICAS